MALGQASASSMSYNYLTKNRQVIKKTNYLQRKISLCQKKQTDKSRELLSMILNNFLSSPGSHPVLFPPEHLPSVMQVDENENAGGTYRQRRMWERYRSGCPALAGRREDKASLDFAQRALALRCEGEDWRVGGIVPKPLTLTPSTP